MVFAFYHLDSQGLLFHDGGTNLLEAKFLDEASHIVFRAHQDSHNPDFWNTLKTETIGVPPHVGKPGFNVILWIAGAMIGFQDSLSAKVTAFFALISFFLTFLIAQKISRSLSALYGVAVLASSTFFMIYARSGLSDMVLTVFFLSGILLYLYSREIFGKRLIYFAGMVFGYAFATTQWRAAYIISLIFCFEFLSVMLWKTWNWKIFILRVIFLFSGFFTTVVLFQLPYVAAQMKFGHLPFPDYWAQLSERLQLGGEMVWFRRPWEFCQIIWQVEGSLFSTLALISWIFLAIRLFIRKQPSDLLLLFFTIVPFTYFSLAKYAGETLPRTIAHTIPITAIAAGQLFMAIHNQIQNRSAFFKKYPLAIIFAVAASILLPAIPRQAKTGITRSGYPEASRYLASTGEKKFMILGMEPVWRFYLGRVAFQPYNRPKSLDELVQMARSEGIQYMMVDHTTIHSKYGLDYTGDLVGKYTPTATFDDPRGVSFPYLLDEMGFEKAVKTSQDPRSGKIYVFAIKDIAGRLGLA